jgi:hypothetical protein
LRSLDVDESHCVWRLLSGFGNNIVEPSSIFQKIYIYFLENDGLYPSLTAVTLANSRRLRWAGHIARMRENRTGLVGEPEKRPPRLSIGWEIILNLVLKNKLRMCGLDWCG